jgi:uncharacterized protein YecT (DUF1311 family)
VTQCPRQPDLHTDYGQARREKIQQGIKEMIKHFLLLVVLLMSVSPVFAKSERAVLALQEYFIDNDDVHLYACVPESAECHEYIIYEATPAHGFFLQNKDKFVKSAVFQAQVNGEKILSITGNFSSSSAMEKSPFPVAMQVKYYEAQLNKQLETAESTASMTKALSEYNKNLDTVLNRAYKEIMASTKGTPLEKTLRQAQRTWLAQRNDINKLIYDNSSGTIAALVSIQCDNILLENRIQFFATLYPFTTEEP